jgi:pimeloyl-ACP methyl ester carboxylesterase
MHPRYRFALGLIVLLPASVGKAGAGVQDGDWSGSFTLPVAATTAPVRVDLQLHGTMAVVALGPGHAADQSVVVQRSGATLRFALPGIPTPLQFALQLHGRALSGSATQGAAKGRVRLTLGQPSFPRFLGTYRLPGGDILIVSDYRRIQYPRWLADVGTDGLRGIYRLRATNYAIGKGVSKRKPEAGSIQFARDGSSLSRSIPGTSGEHAVHLSFRQEEVRFANGDVALAGTLTLPAGAGPFPAVVLVHGSGASLRDEDQNWQGFLASHGIASLSMDKRGVGQSGGSFPGEFPNDWAVATYASDAEAGGRFLATQPLIASKRIGLFGGSQAGWIIAEAAAEAGSLFSFAVILSGPVVSVGESDYYAELTTQGATKPSLTLEQIDAQVLAQGPSGFDPRPFLRTLRIPILWIYGGKDQNQPTRLDIPVLQELKAATGADFSWVVFPDANHGLIPTQNGLNSEADAAPGLAPGFFAALESWLRSHSIGS